MPKEGDIGAELSNGSLRIEFRWEGDRFGHRLIRADDRLESVESETLDTPVFQEVHRQGELLFASGMSGGRHWSASIEPAEEGFLFDVACRVKSAGRDAASCYRGNGFRAEAIAVEGMAPAVSIDGHSLTIGPSPTRSDTPQTTRYRYRIAPAPGKPRRGGGA